MEAHESSAVIERTVRRAIRHLLPDWQDRIGDRELSSARRARDSETRKRPGVGVPSDLLEFLYTGPLFSLVRDHADVFAPMFHQPTQVAAFLHYAESLRNTSAHVRELVTFERDMLAGIAGYLSSHLVRWETRNIDLAADYPTIADVRDSFGQEAVQGFVRIHSGRQIVHVGDQIEISAQAVEARGKGVRWWFGFSGSANDLVVRYDPTKPGMLSRPPMALGASVRYRYRVKSADVGPEQQFFVVIASTSKHHKESWIDDARILHYRVRPPHDA